MSVQPTWSLQHDTVVALLDSIDWFASLTQDELEDLARRTQTVHWEFGEIVFEEGARGEQCYVIHSGSVKVLRRFPDGRRITLARLAAGSVVGELALFNGIPNPNPKASGKCLRYDDGVVAITGVEGDYDLSLIHI